MKYETAEDPAKSGQSGVILPLLAVLLFVLVLFFVAIVDFGLFFHTNVELQSAADAAATAGARQLCSSKRCFEYARGAAIKTLATQQVRTISGAHLSLDLGATLPTDGVSEWDLSATSDLIVHIERGIWNGTTFQTTEGTWNADHPGMPNYVISNAVRVQLARTRSGLVTRYLTYTPDQVRSSALAIKGFTENVQVAPFAIPVCSILDRRAEYYGENDEREVCHGDFSFTKASRYEDTTGGFFLRPGFAWAPCSETNYSSSNWDADFGRGYFPDQFAIASWLTSADALCKSKSCPTCGVCPPIPNTSGLSGDFCFSIGGQTGGGYSYGASVTGFGNSGFFPMPSEFPQVDMNGWRSGQDHFGVVGYPGLDGASSQANIKIQVDSLINSSSDPKVSTHIGDTFRILGGGLTDGSMDGRLWSIITSAPDERHKEIGLTELGTVERNLGIFQASVGFDDAGGFEDWACDFLPCPPVPEMDAASGIPWRLGMNHGLDEVEAGICNSHWFNYDPTTMRVGAEKNLHFWPKWVARAEPVKSAGIDDRTTIWDTIVPVIADPAGDATDCSSPDPFHTPPPDPNRLMLVVGYMRMFVYDVDIGKAPPQAKFRFPNGELKAVGNWAFSGGNCNTVRARLHCDRTFIPTSDVQQETAIRLVQ